MVLIRKTNLIVILLFVGLFLLMLHLSRVTIDDTIISSEKNDDADMAEQERAGESMDYDEEQLLKELEEDLLSALYDENEESANEWHPEEQEKGNIAVIDQSPLYGYEEEYEGVLTDDYYEEEPENASAKDMEIVVVEEEGSQDVLIPAKENVVEPIEFPDVEIKNVLDAEESPPNRYQMVEVENNNVILEDIKIIEDLPLNNLESSLQEEDVEDPFVSGFMPADVNGDDAITAARHIWQHKVHSKSRSSPYFNQLVNVQRLTLIDEEVPWTRTYLTYDPPAFTQADVLQHPMWADPEILDDTIIFNVISDNVNRRSFMGTFFLANGLPRNPMGRTGLKGRGAFGRWGPNHCIDPIVTRWKKDMNGNIVFDESSSKPILQFAAILRDDAKEWAIPGGMINGGEDVIVGMWREFVEEAMGYLNANESVKNFIDETVRNYFENGKDIYKGYVDDPRNTDNAWLETTATLFHDDGGYGLGSIQLTPGDGALDAEWHDIDKSMVLFANQIDYFSILVRILNAHW